MPTVSIDSKVSLSVKDARTILTGFNKALGCDSVTTKTLALNPGTSGSLNLSFSSFVIVIGLSDVLDITVQNKNSNTITWENVGFYMIQSSNLYSITITNTSSELQNITLIF